MVMVITPPLDDLTDALMSEHLMLLMIARVRWVSTIELVMR
jgi:hypothetical protein